MPARLAAAVLAVLALAACGGGGGPAADVTTAPATGAADEAAAANDPGPLHVHGLGPAPDGGLYVATHTGLFRVVDGGLERIGSTVQDLMGFTVADEETLLASGHPDPADPERLVAAGERGIVRSEDGGRSWRVLERRIGLLAWPEGGPVYLVDAEGAIHASEDGRRWRRVGEVGEPPAALAAAGPRELWFAGHDGDILRSEDGGRTWTPFASF